MKLLVIDDQAIVRQGIAALLTHDDPATVVLQAGDSAQGLDLAAQHADLDAVFLDLAMPGMGGMAAIAEFGRRRPDVPVIVLTASDDPQKARLAFEYGALGYVSKSASAQTLLAALRLVLNGETYVPALVLRAESTGEAETAEAAPRAADGRLTDRQAEVLGCMSLGLSNKDIGRRLGLAEKTVKAHVTGVLRGLGAANRAEAVRLARVGGLI
jgi:two-component system, NarL family, nitrate/nitrite response regulator NarL